MTRKLLILSILFCSVMLRISGQYYSTGQSPASFRWHRLKTDHFSFIFPSSYDGQIMRTALVFEEAWDIIGGKYGVVKFRKIPVIIHNHSIESNGYVAWAPSRVELYPLPVQDNIPLDHIEQLALHELNHVAQMQGLTNGISRPLTYIFGEQFTGALGIYTPFWFLEGDAVVSETIHSNSGRGRTPSFEKHLKALLVEKDVIYSYDKMLNGSFRDFTPDHYRFGYQMTAWTMKEFGQDIWTYPVGFAARKPYSINPFNFSLKEKTGLRKRDIYFQTMSYLKDSWSMEIGGIQSRSPVVLNPDKGNDYINYYSPLRAGRDSILAIRTTLFDIPRFVLINSIDKTEKILFTPGYVWPFRLSFSNGIIVWAEERNDPRWENRGYSVIMKRDIARGLTTQLSFQSRWFSPDISPDGKVIVAAESSPANENALLFLDAGKGELIKKIPAPGNILPVAPKWTDDMSEIVFISYSGEGEGIMTYNPDSDLWTTHIPQSNIDLESVRMRGDTIFFISSSSGTENIYFIDNHSNIKQIGSSKFGAAGISLDGDQVIFSDYTSDGYNIGSLPIAESSMEVVGNEFVKPVLIGGIDSEKKLTYNESDHLAGSYVIEKYPKGLHLFNIHSWMPFYTDIGEFSNDHLPVSAGLTVMSQNHLSTLTTTLGYEYTGGEHLLHSRISYEGMLPVFDFDLTYGGTPAVLQDNDNTSSPSVLYRGFRANSSVYLPLYFQSGRFNQTLWPSYRLSYSNNYIFDDETSLYDYGQTIGTARFYFSNFQKRSYRDIWPRFGQVVEYYFTHSPTDADLYGKAHTFRSTLYFPGVFRNNSIRLRYQAEKQAFERFLYYNKVSYPRGYNHIISADIKVYSIDYSFPLAYPDINLGSIIYLNRIRSVLFYDWASGKENYYVQEREIKDGPELFSSGGAELMADFNILRIPFGFSAGVQAAWLPLRKEPYFNLLFNIDVFGFVLGKESHPF